MPVTSSDAAAAVAPGDVGPIENTVDLRDYLAALQDGPAASAASQWLANPAHLAGEAVEAFEGFAQEIQAVFAEASTATPASRVADGAGDAGASEVRETHGGESRHGGPAQEPFDPAEGTSPSTRRHQFEGTLDRLETVMWAGVQTSVLVTGTSGLSKSANTLLRGQ